MLRGTSKATIPRITGKRFKVDKAPFMFK